MVEFAVARTNFAYLSERGVLDCLCGARGGLTIRRSERNGLRFRYKVCLRCGHVRTSDPLSPRAAERFYSTSDYRSMYFPNESVEEVLIRQTPKANSRSRLLEYVEQSGVSGNSILDWGCGGGWNLVPFRDAGWRTIGFDYDQPFVAAGRSVLNLELHEIDSETLNRAKEFAPDVILLYHVLEHAIDPVRTLKILREISKPESRLLVGIPLLEKIPSWTWGSFFHIAHIHYFSRISFRRAAAMSGWKVTRHQLGSSMFLLEQGGFTSNPEYRLKEVAMSLI